MTAASRLLPASDPGSRHLSVVQQLAAQLGHVTVELWRVRVVFIFTFLFPLTWLVMLGFLVGNDAVDQTSGVRVMQFMVPIAAAMGVLYATFPTVAASLSVARERGALKRVRGTPLPAWMYLAGRIGGAVVFAVGAVLAMLVVGVVAYDLQIVWRTAAATVVTIVVAIACFTAAGLAVATLARSAGLAQTIAIAAAVILSFLSGLYSPGGSLPEWADRLAAALPLKPFVAALQDQFNPFGSGNGWDVGALAIMLAWGVVAGVIATITFRWSAPEARRSSMGRVSNRPAAGTAALPMQLNAEQLSTPGRLPRVVQMWGQIHHVLTSVVRNPGWVFFAVAMPVGLFVFLMWSIAPGQPPIAGVPFGISLAAGMITWGTAVTAFVNTPEAVARQRDLGYLKRLQGTPLHPMNYFFGRAVGAALVAIVMAAAITAIGRLAFGLQFAWWGIPLATAVLALGTLTLAACGFVLAAIVPSSTAVTAVGLAILLPVAFFSGIFTIGLTPNWMSAIGSMLPMKPIAASLAAAMNPAGPAVNWIDLAVLCVWLAVAGAVCLRMFSWSRETGTRAGR